MAESLKLFEMATRIGQHLCAMERDPLHSHLVDGRTALWQAGAWARGRFVYVRYIAYQSASHLTKNEAAKYLEWLDAGNRGRHYKALEKTI